MKCEVKNLENQKVGDITLSSDIFGLPERNDILFRVIDWQLARRRAGTHKTKGVSEISGTTRKPYKQKGTGRARQGSLRSPQFRGGAVIFGPVVRSHEIKLPKKVRKLGLKTALSQKFSEGKLVVVDSLDVKNAKTKDVIEKFEKMGLSTALFIGGEVPNENFVRASSNLFNVDVLSHNGINVYDIIRRDYLVLTKDSVEYLEQRLK
ncbi:MAG: 50S ribosomal protein L4 [Candidatus Nucleicultricaceae bacterium]